MDRLIELLNKLKQSMKDIEEYLKDKEIKQKEEKQKKTFHV